MSAAHGGLWQDASGSRLTREGDECATPHNLGNYASMHPQECQRDSDKPVDRGGGNNRQFMEV